MEKRVSRPRRSKGVAFAPFCDVRYHLHKNDMSTDEITSTWTSREERRLTELEAKTTIGFMRHRPEQVTEENGRCGRGLEHLVKSTVVRTRRKIKENVMNAVFFEQERQILSASVPNADAIRSASRYHSKPSEQRAIMLAEADTEYVTNMLIVEDLQAIVEDLQAQHLDENTARRRDSLHWDDMQNSDNASRSTETHRDEVEKDDDASDSTSRTSNRRHSMSMYDTTHWDEVEGKEEEKGDNESLTTTRRAQRRHSMPANLNPWTTGTAA